MKFCWSLYFSKYYLKKFHEKLLLAKKLLHLSLNLVSILNFLFNIFCQLLSHSMNKDKQTLTHSDNTTHTLWLTQVTTHTHYGSLSSPHTLWLTQVTQNTPYGSLRSHHTRTMAHSDHTTHALWLTQITQHMHYGSLRSSGGFCLFFFSSCFFL